MRTDAFSFERLQILNSTSADLDFIFKLFASAIDYQKKNRYDLWPQFSREFIENELSEERHWKVCNGASIVGVFSVLYNDPVIWGERDQEPSVYLHRITVNPSFKGKGLMQVVKTWAQEHAKQKGKRFVRMDTWGDNVSLRRYYMTCGFQYIGQQYLTDVEGQPPHYGGSVLSLFQTEI
jgi:GNAT superfamily N-acetyltransferase